MIPLIDMVGKTSGKLTVIEYDHPSPHGAWWKCRCECGRVVSRKGSGIRDGRDKSCGKSPCCRLLMRGKGSRGRYKHFRGTDGMISRWHGMKSRCYRPSSAGWKDYGGRGIKVCSRWRKSFMAFLDDMGECPSGLTIDRIDVNGHYSCGNCMECMANDWPMNCRWATWIEQAANRRPYPNRPKLPKAERDKLVLIHSRLKKGIPMELAGLPAGDKKLWLWRFINKNPDMAYHFKDEITWKTS